MRMRTVSGTCLLVLAFTVAAYGQRAVGNQAPVASQAKRPQVGRGQAELAGTYDDPIELEVRQNVKVVYQIKTGGWKKGVGAGLHYLDKLAGFYDKRDASAADRQIVGVFQGDAGYFLLKDPAYRKAADKPGENPNKEIIQKLLDAGVQLNLCKSTMQNHGWTGDDVLPGVKIVAGAYPRIIDLQLRGYAYIRF